MLCFHKRKKSHIKETQNKSTSLLLIFTATYYNIGHGMNRITLERERIQWRK
jgi:phosphate/sulfate permease